MPQIQKRRHFHHKLPKQERKTIEAKFYNGGFKRLKPSEDSEISTMPNFIIHSSTTSLIDRLKAQKCELCGATDRLEMHHVRKLKGLKGKEPWKQFMIARKENDSIMQ